MSTESVNNATQEAPEVKERLPVTTTNALPIAAEERGLRLTTFDEIWRFACAVAKSGFAPKGMDKPEALLVAIQHGLELGLAPMQAIQSIAVINGRPSIYGDAALALVRASGKLEYYTQKIEGAKEQAKAIVKCKRTDDPEPVESIFTVEDAKKAGLWGKVGPWTQYPERMLLWRARGFALRDAFGDVLKGLATTEEVLDMPAAIEHQPRELPQGRVVHRKAKTEVKEDPAPETKGELFDGGER